MTLRDMVAHEWRTRLGQPAALASLAAFAVILVFAAWSGRVERDARAQAIDEHESQVSAAMQEWLTHLTTLETRGEQAGIPVWSASPMDLELPSSLPSAPLADFSIGQADLLPSTGKLSLWDPDVRLFSRYEFEDPVALALGAFDLSKAIVLLLPLLIIVLSFDVLSAERDAGRLGLTLVQASRVRRLFWQRLAIRGAVVIGLSLLLATAALAFNGGSSSLSERLASFALWAACAFLYGMLWLAIIAWIATRNRSGESNIVQLLLCWAGLTLIVPAAVTATTEAIYPPPSRLAYLAQARQIEIDTERTVDSMARSSFLDHPELIVDSASEMPAYLRTAYFVTSTVDKATRPVLDAFERTAARRDAALALARYASPAIIAHGIFNDAAGSSSARHRRYMEQARAYKAAYAELAGPHIATGQLMPSRSVTAFPRFQFRDEAFSAVVAAVVPALFFIALATAVLLAFADRRLQRFRPLP